MPIVCNSRVFENSAFALNGVNMVLGGFLCFYFLKYVLSGYDFLYWSPSGSETCYFRISVFFIL